MSTKVDNKKVNSGENKGYFLGVPFKDGDVYKYLEQEKAEFIVGMDIGDGECVVYFYNPDRMDENGVIKAIRVYFDKVGGKIPSMLSVDKQGKVLIGSAAKDSNSFYHQFKVPPSRWDERLGGKTKKEITELFITELWRLVKSESGEVRAALENGKLMIAVGCPADKEWMSEASMKAYKELVRKATGCKKVAIVPESTAAAMTAVMPNGKVNSEFLTKGIAVIDIGSSTIDFTYLYFGKVLITRSEHIAGSDIDAQMLRVALEKDSNNYILESDANFNTDVDLSKLIDFDEANQLLVELRLLKERFYAEGCRALYQPVCLFKRDENGEIISVKTVTVLVNEDFMKAALTKAYGKRSAPSNSKSWLTIMEEFVGNTSALIPRDENGKLACDKVIITGGTGNVTQLKEVIVGVYGDKLVSVSDDSSTGVAQGLCYSKAVEIKAANAIKAFNASLEDIGKKHAGGFINEIVKESARSQYAIVGKVAKNFLNSGKEPTVNDFSNAVVTANAKQKNTVDAKKIEEIYMTCLDGAAKELTGVIDSLSENLYKVKIDNNTTVHSMVNDSLNAVKIDKLLNGVVNNKNAVVQTVMNVVSGISYGLAMGALSAGQVHLSILFLAIGFIFGSASVQNKIGGWSVLQNRKMGKGTLKKIIDETEDPKQLEKIMEKSLKNNDASIKGADKMQKEFIESVKTVGEICLGKVLMLVFDKHD